MRNAEDASSSSRVLNRVRVQNADGQSFIVSEVELAETMPDGRVRKLIQFVLDDAGPGMFVDKRTFVLASSGERYFRCDTAAH